MKKNYTAGDVCRITGMPYQTLRKNVDKGYVVPSVAKPNGKGSKALYNYDDLLTIKLFQKLSESGFTHEKASQLARYKEGFLVKIGKVPVTSVRMCKLTMKFAMKYGDING